MTLKMQSPRNGALRVDLQLKAHCILGMNVLREFLITIDSTDRTITLKHRPYPKRYHLENYSVSMLADAADLEKESLNKVN